ncbi:MAG: branched-chain amino acid ABC transporter permease, partial [Chloroflexi bacterium]
MVGGGRVHRPHPRPRLPSERDPRPGPRRAGMNAVLGRISSYAANHRSTSLLIGWALIGTLLPLVVLIPPLSTFQGQTLWLGGFANAGVFILLALGLNIVVGLAGLLDLGYAAFFAIGSYAYAFGASPFTGLHVPFWPMLIVGALVAATFGILLGAPTLRLRGDYLAIVTLGFGEIVPAIFLNADKYTLGTNGIGGVAQPELGPIKFNFSDPLPFYMTMIVILALVMVFVYRLQDSRLGRAWQAIREDELAAASSGVNTITTKLLAF